MADLKTVKNLLKHVQNYNKNTQLSPKEYIQDLAKTDKKLTEKEIEAFLTFMKHGKLLDVISEDIIEYWRLRLVSRIKIKLLCYIIIFYKDDSGYNKPCELFWNTKVPYCDKIYNYFTEEPNLIFITQEACKHFGSDYVISNIIQPIFKNIAIFERCVTQDKPTITVKPPTLPIEPNFLSVRKKIPTVPVNTPDSSEIVHFKSTEMPKKMFKTNTVAKQLTKHFELNKEKAQQLLETAKKLAPRVANVTKSERTLQPEGYSFKARKLPSERRPVQFKNNLATLLRQAAIEAKSQEEEINNIENIMQGGWDSEYTKQIESEFRKTDEEEYLAEIERKKLKCLITREEAILAKQNIIKINKEKMEVFQKERKQLLDDLEQWREFENEKMKLIVDKIHDMEKGAKESEQKLLESKQLNARLVQFESKRMMQQFYQEREDELAKKVELIKEIKTLHQIQTQNVKTFDPTDCPNVGLLCEMSLSELHERLTIMKMETEDELKKRKREINVTKQRQQQLFENAKNFITQSRMSKPKVKSLPSCPVNLEQKPELVALRHRLEEVRALRGPHKNANT